MREYLELEFLDVKDKLQFNYDIEKVIDDWIFMCFMVGNDFIPHLPNLHINSDALPTLYKAYCQILPELDGEISIWEFGCKLFTQYWPLCKMIFNRIHQ